MKMKSFSKPLAILVMALASATTMAADPMRGIVGYDAKEAGGGWTTLTPGTVGADGSYAVTLTRLIAVSSDDLGMPDAFIDKKTNPVTKQPVFLYRVDAGTVYAMGLGTLWGNIPEEVQKIPTDKAIAHGNVVNGTATLQFVRVAGEQARPVNWVVKFPNGKQAWGSHPGQTHADSPWVATNVNGAPLTVWAYDGNNVVPAPNAVIKAFLGRK